MTRWSFSRVVTRRLVALGLRFADCDDEARFKAGLEAELLRSTLGGAIVTCIGSAIHGVSSFLEQPEMATPNWMILVCQQTLWLAVPAVLATLIALRLALGCLKGWNWELLVVACAVYGAVAIVAGQTHHLTLGFGYDFAATWSGSTSKSEAWSLLGLNLLSTVIYFQLRIRVVFSWLVPLAGGITFIITSACLLEVAYTQAIYALALMALSYFSWAGSAINERHLRAKWLAMQSVQVKEEEIHEKDMEIKEHLRSVSLLHQVLGVFCDTLIYLDKDLMIQCPGGPPEVFFERPVHGISFLELLRNDDVDRFQACVRRATQARSPEVVLVTLHRCFTVSEAQLLLLDTGAETRRYMLGVRVERDHPPQTRSEAGESEEPPVAMAAAMSEPLADRLHPEMLLGMGPRGVSAPGGHSLELPGMPSSLEAPVGRSLTAPQERGEATSIVPAAKPMRAIDETSPSNFTLGNAPRPTGCRARCATLRLILRRWMVPRCSTSCCHFHTTVASIAEVFDALLQESCEPLFSPFPEQCRRCLSMNMNPTCVVCGFVSPSELR